MPKSLYAKSLSIGWNNTAIIEELNFEIQPGCIFMIYGQNGSGKSTLLKSVFDNSLILLGDWCIGQTRFSSMSNKKRAQHIGYLAQTNTIYADLSAYDVIFLGASASNVTKTEMAIANAAALLQTTSLLQRRYNLLSGGQRQRIQLTRLIAQGCTFLLLDEPTQSLDPKQRHTFWQTCSALRNEGHGLCIVSHDLNAVKHCNEALVLSQGHGKRQTHPNANDILSLLG